MMLSPDGPPAIPLWINGRAFLTMTPDFYEVQHAQTGEALWRTPLCGTDEVAEAVAAAQGAMGSWQAQDVSARQSSLSAWADGLQGYAEHFAKLVTQETGMAESAAQAEVAQAVAALKGDDQIEAEGCQALVWDDSLSLAGVVGQMAPLLRSGVTLVLKPSPRMPGSAYALVELSGRVGLPAGIVNLVQGDEVAVSALCAHEGVSRLVFVGRPELGNRVGAMAAKEQKPFTLRV